MAYPIKKLSELFLGEWNSTTTYTIGDIVDHNGSSFACIKESINNEPPDTTYWALLANKGDKGDTGEQGIPGEQGEIGIDWQGDWMPREYTARQAVYHNGSSYIATTTTTQEPPNTDWDLIALKGTDAEEAGDVLGPSSAVDDDIVLFSGTTGKLLKDSGHKLSDYQTALGFTPENSANKVTAFQSTPDNTHYPSEKLVKDSLDTKMTNPMTASGDLIYGGASGTPTRLAKGTDGQVLTLASGVPTWAAGGGMVYPSAGIAVSTGSSWGTSLTAPTGAIVGTTDTQTLTNKRINPRLYSTTSTSTLSPNVDNYDIFEITALAENLTINNFSGTPVNGQQVIIRIKDNGTSRYITWYTDFLLSGVTPPSAWTRPGVWMYYIFQYNSAGGGMGTGGWDLIRGDGIRDTRIWPRVSSVASVSSITPELFLYNTYKVTALAGNLTINNPATSYIADGEMMMFIIKDNGTSRTISWGSSYANGCVDLPTATTASKWLWILIQWDRTDSKGYCISVGTQS